MLGRRLTLLGLPLVLLRLARKATAGQRDDQEGLKERLERAEQQVRELTAAFEAFKKTGARHEGLISNLSRTSPPVGTVMAFAGPWPPTDAKGKRWTEAELGWLHCDGREILGLEYEELRAILGKDSLPDYRGFFLRGLDTTGERDKGRLVDRGRRELRTLSSEQGFLTAPPREKDFATGNQSDNPIFRQYKYIHSHVHPTGRGEAASFFSGWEHPERPELRARRTEGDHPHTIVRSSGDPETRPINVAVYWIIKYK